MIGRLTGTLIEKRPPTVTVDVNGVAYELDVPMNTLYQLPAAGSKVTLYTHLVVREDAHLLFGFASEQERQVFRQLLRVNGVGARTALAVLSGLSVQELYQAVATRDGTRLTRIPGVGKKIAERLLLELKDKLAVGETAAGDGALSARADALHALRTLGYSDKEAAAALAKVAADTPVPEAIRQALRLLSRTS
ncbi:MAG TPA: Holliday junction branch migration protein RuvA [Burkholderiales bacterium]|nr:Holliday junction branch migration protein RuvA [Burkholderiales bacterium]